MRAFSTLTLLILAAFSAGAASAAVICDPGQAVLSRADGTEIARFSVEVADNVAEREQGLMNRAHLAAGAGMLFVYPSERGVYFWMKNTLIPLDMLFFDGAGRLVSLHRDARPMDETPIPSDGPARFVLEINGGAAAQFGIGAGTVLSYPAIAPEVAALPCK